jgi:hypothetical protein
MTSRGGEPRRVGRSASGPRLVPVSLVAEEAAEPDYVDEALDDLLTTLDDLVRDLDVDEAEPEAARIRAPAGPPVHSRAFVVGLAVVLILLEFLILAWLLSNV